MKFPEKRGNLNKNILIENIIDYKDASFIIINEDIWNKIKSNYPDEKTLVYNGIFQNHKFLLEINRKHNNHIFYFYYINDKGDIEEGYFKFNNFQQSNNIIMEFNNLKVNEFFRKMKIQKNNNNEQIISYNGENYIVKIKGNKRIKKSNKQIDYNNFNINNNNNNYINNNRQLNINNNNEINENLNSKEYNNQNHNKSNNLKNKNKDNNHNIKNNEDNNNIIKEYISNINPSNKNYNNNIKDNNNNKSINNNNLNNKYVHNDNSNNINNKDTNNYNNKYKNIINNYNDGKNKNYNNINNQNYNQNQIYYNMQSNNNKHHHRSKSAGHIKINKAIIHLQHANGLDNVGATCYMNATLQCLANIKQLTEYFIKIENTQKILSNPIKYKLSNSYLEVLNNLWLNSRIKNYAPNGFKTLISDMNPLFAGIQANDSKDLVLFLLETMHNELNTAEKINPSNAILKQYDFETTLKLFVKFFKNNYKSIFSDIFYGMYNSMMTCLNCQKTTHNVQCYNILIFPLEEVRKYKNRIQNIVDIRECFEYYQKDDHMFGENQIFCNNCHAMSNSINKSKLIVCPNVLVINLNRGKGLQYDIKIKFEEYLDIKEFIYNDKSPSYYELVGIVTHFGPSSMGGHFIAFCKSFMDQNWYKYNDALVNISSFQEASTTGVPYILFYSFIKR